MTTEELKQAMINHAKAEYPKEACGVITTTGEYIPCVNTALDPLKDFELDTSQFSHSQIAGIFHSHPNATNAPSAMDMKGQLQTAVPWWICSIDGDKECTEPYCWGSDYIPPLVGREFRHGASGTDDKGDCYALIRDYYKQERGITLPEFPRSDGWWKTEQNLYDDLFAEAGFTQTYEPKVGDVFFAAVLSDKNNHAGILLDGGLILHHLSGRLSARQPLGLWQRLITKWVTFNNA